jgi:hypothetical protein
MTSKTQQWNQVYDYFGISHGSNHHTHFKSHRCLSFIKAILDGDPVAIVMVVAMILLIGIS